MLFGLILNTFSQSDITRDYVNAESDLTVRDTSIIELIEEHTSGSTISGANGNTKVGSDIEWGGSFTKATSIQGVLNNLTLGTTGSKINDFTINTQTLTVTSDNDIVLTSSGLSCTWDGSLLICGSDTVATLDDIRTEIAANKAVQPFNFPYTFDVSTTDSRPGAGYFKLNNPVIASTTYLYIDYVDNEGIDQSLFLETPDTGSYIYIKTNEWNYALFQLIGDLTDAGNYFKYRVNYLGHSGAVNGACTIDLELSNSVGSGGGIDSSLASSTNQINLIGDTLKADTANIIAKTLIALDSLKLPDGTWLTGTDTSENLVIDSITTNNFSLNGSDYLDTTYAIGDIGVEISSVGYDSIIFNPVSSSEHQDGNLNYDDLTSSLVFKNDVDSTELNIGEEFRHRVYNNSGATILNNKAVRRTGSHTNGRRLPTIALSGIGSVDSAKVYGVTTHTIPNNSFGYVVKHGDVNFCNTSNLSEDESYLGFAGSQIDTMPYPPYKSIKVAEVIYSDNDSGIVDVDILDMGFSKTPTLSANLYDSTILIDIATQNVYQIITNDWNNAFHIEDEIGVNYVGDSIQVLVSGQWNIAFSTSFAGTVSADTWKEGVFVNGVLRYNTERYTSSTATGNISGIVGLNLNANDWVSFKMVNTTSARDFTLKNKSISLIFLHE